MKTVTRTNREDRFAGSMTNCGGAALCRCESKFLSSQRTAAAVLCTRRQNTPGGVVRQEFS
jgi:hypothetical protein